jgi:anti-anti-sigma factor
MKLFLSYRHGDSPHATDRLVDRLIGEFGRDNVFYDIDSIPIGVNWRTRITDSVSQCDVFVAVVGDKWVEELRLREGTNDMVRFEIESALKRGIPIVPILVSNAAFPSRESLPSEIADFADWNGLQLRPGLDFQVDMRRLIDRLQEFARALRALEPPSAQNDSSGRARSITMRLIDRLMELVGAAPVPKASPALNAPRKPFPPARGVPTEKNEKSDKSADIQIRKINNVLVFNPQAFTTDEQCYRFYETLKVAATDGNSRIVLDCQEIRHLSSLALSTLIRCHRYLRLAGGDLRVCCLHPAIRDLFRVTRLDKMIEVSETADAAINAFETDSGTNK